MLYKVDQWLISRKGKVRGKITPKNLSKLWERAPSISGESGKAPGDATND
jgi:hypothetical protein